MALLRRNQHQVVGQEPRPKKNILDVGIRYFEQSIFVGWDLHPGTYKLSVKLNSKGIFCLCILRVGDVLSLLVGSCLTNSFLQVL